jgi:oligosaccharyltransferase complex subunit beta
VVIDHLSYAVSDTEGDHTLIASDNLIKSNVILGKKAIEVRSLQLISSVFPFM